MQKLEYLNLENADLTNLALDFPLPQRLKVLRMAGNPLRCDCQTRWLWEEARGRRKSDEEGKFDLPRCATPFSLKNVELTTLKGKKKHRTFSRRKESLIQQMFYQLGIALSSALHLLKISKF